MMTSVGEGKTGQAPFEHAVGEPAGCAAAIIAVFAPLAVRVYRRSIS
jgi:hypothetical protein